jgi:hypothetical protein
MASLDRIAETVPPLGHTMTSVKGWLPDRSKKSLEKIMADTSDRKKDRLADFIYSHYLRGGNLIHQEHNHEKDGGAVLKAQKECLVRLENIREYAHKKMDAEEFKKRVVEHMPHEEAYKRLTPAGKDSLTDSWYGAKSFGNGLSTGKKFVSSPKGKLAVTHKLYFTPVRSTENLVMFFRVLPKMLYEFLRMPDSDFHGLASFKIPGGVYGDFASMVDPYMENDILVLHYYDARDKKKLQDYVESHLKSKGVELSDRPYTEGFDLKGENRMDSKSFGEIVANNASKKILEETADLSVTDAVDWVQQHIVDVVKELAIKLTARLHKELHSEETT